MCSTMLDDKVKALLFASNSVVVSYVNGVGENWPQVAKGEGLCASHGWDAVLEASTDHVQRRHGDIWHRVPAELGQDIVPLENS